MSSRTIAIGDVHGCSVALDALLSAIAPTPEDTIITLGDYIDRGPDSRGVLDRLIALGKQCNHVPLLGNHDQTLLDVLSGRVPIEWFFNIGGKATMDSYGNGRDLTLIPIEHIEFLESCKDFEETDTHIFVHANYDPNLPMSEQPESLMRWESLRDGIPDRHQSGKIVVVGHSAQKYGDILDLDHLKCIDTYCYGGEWLTALEVITGQMWQVNPLGQMRKRHGAAK